ncbi:hypothetical protein CSHISOI_04940 [Colletotrichum shisoi]|uniref:Uncharacterized protein n=1 Tax=Colletotrichum shisoi TaxID=2078593 RepID=A0A5Q4BUP2_9PEZI|nr:hypothetical protein CSHISOI_04940 [Colletotrichum shisoi]
MLHHHHIAILQQIDHHHHHHHAATTTTTTTVPTPDDDADAASPASTSFYRTEELVAFQISTNAAIRRFLNRVNSVVYDSRDQFRMTRASYADWLLRTTADLWSYHGALYRNLPDFLLTSQPRRRAPDPPDHEGVSNSPTAMAAATTTPGIIRVEELGDNPWNVLRLKGRYSPGSTEGGQLRYTPYE